MNIQRTRAGFSDRHLSKDLMLDRNERAVDFGEDISRRLADHLAKQRYNLYPELGPFYAKLAKWVRVPSEQLLVTEGVTGAIKIILEALEPEGNNIVVPTPSFALYPVLGKLYEFEVREVTYDAGSFSLKLSDLMGAIDENTSAVFLPNPNMPVESYFSSDELADLAEHCQKTDTFLILDEVYWLFGGHSAIDLLPNFPNVMVMRSFSKAFGLAGVRIGYLAAHSDVIDMVSRLRGGYESSTPAMAIAEFFIENIDVINGYVAEVKAGLELFKQGLKDLGLPHYGGNYGNFIYVEFADVETAQLISNKAREAGIHLRGGWSAPYDKGVSMAGAPAEAMQRVLDVFKDVLAEKNQ